jgi:small-conductance mechanosensitive channel
MEQQTNNESDLFSFRIDERAKETLRSIASWAIIIVITTVIGYVIGLIAALKPKPETVLFREGFGGSAADSHTTLGSVIFSMIIGLVITWFLYQFGVLTKRGVDKLSQNDLNRGFASLKIYFMIIGILIIIGFAFVLLAVLAIRR